MTANMEVGTRFLTIDDAKIVVQEWAIEHSLLYKVLKAVSAF